MPTSTNDLLSAKEGSATQKNVTLQILVPALIAAAAYVLHALIIHASTSRLADTKHVSKLLVLPEHPETADANLKQVQLFMHSGWRRYLSSESLDGLSHKSQRLFRAKSAYPLKISILSILSKPIRDEDLDLVSRQLVAYQSDKAFKWLDIATKNAVEEFRGNVVVRRASIAKAKLAEEERMREQHEGKGVGSDGIDDPSLAAQHGLVVGPRGGCYYITESGHKNYVDRSDCY